LDGEVLDLDFAVKESHVLLEFGRSLEELFLAI
jgi:hypothetical protein